MGARERLVSCVDSSMSVQVMFAVKGFAAYAARVRSIAGVRLLVSYQIALVSEGLPTNLKTKKS